VKNTEMHYMQDCPVYNHFQGFTQDSNLMNSNPNPNRNSRT